MERKHLTQIISMTPVSCGPGLYSVLRVCSPGGERIDSKMAETLVRTRRAQRWETFTESYENDRSGL